MLVYGNPRQRASGRDSFAQLAESAGVACAEDVRGYLIGAGQLEQAVEDAQPPPGSETCSKVQALTDHFASALYAKLRGQAPPAWAALTLPELPEHMEFNVPEGYAYYCLYPEQYCFAAERWAAGREPGRVLVVGLRSIGTSLSAVVAAVLRARGWTVNRFTVRPQGHPFHREVALPENTPRDTSIVVDEGPGLSGSSMAAAAKALTDHGVEDITFFPGHSGEPGPQANGTVRAWWRRIPRYVCPLHEVTWNGGGNLGDLLGNRTAELLKCARSSVVVQELRAGEWRRLAYRNEADWPCGSGMFERAKYLGSDGSRSILWKYDGLGILGRNGEERRSSRSVPILDVVAGFAALPWIEGRRLTRDDLDHRVLTCMAGHIRDRARRVPDEQLADGVDRLRRMAVFNATQLAGGDEAKNAEGQLEALGAYPPGPAYGDGHLGCHEWVRNETGALTKTDWWGHDCDHTVVGVQSVLWDVAGAIVEWGMGPARQSELVEACGHTVEPQCLASFVYAYAAFRAGLLSTLRAQAEVDERERLGKELQRIRNFLGRT